MGSVEYSLKTRNASKKQVLEVLLKPDIRNELGLSENQKIENNGLLISGRRAVRNIKAELRKGSKDDEAYINVVFFTTTKNSIVSSKLENHAWKNFQFLKKVLSESDILFEEVNADEQTSFLLDSIENCKETLQVISCDSAYRTRLGYPDTVMPSFSMTGCPANL